MTDEKTGGLSLSGIDTDTRVWKYRTVDGQTESRLFASVADVPAGEGWEAPDAKHFSAGDATADVAESEPAAVPAEAAPADPDPAPEE